MSEMVGRVAKAIGDCLYGHVDKNDTPNTWGMAMDAAEAAIAAMREPTEGMTAAGWEHTADPCWQEDVGKAWQAMIDEALK